MDCACDTGGAGSLNAVGVLWLWVVSKRYVYVKRKNEGVELGDGDRNGEGERT